jgi:hypothetical protein
MPIAPVRAPRRHGLIAGMLLVSGLAAPASRALLSVEVEPGALTWRDRARVTVRGSTPSHCAGDPVVAETPRVDFQVVSLDLSDNCGILTPPPPPVPFAVSATLPPLLPGIYSLRVHNFASGETLVAPLEVYDASRLELELPDATNAAAARALVRGWASCPGIHEVRVAGRVIEMDYFGDCQVLPPGATVFELEAELGVLEAGGYQVRVFDHDQVLGVRPALARGALVVRDAAGCVPSPSALCLHAGRFRATATWVDFDGGAGAGGARPLADGDDSGLFWFFSPESVELTLRVLDACGVNGRFWVFLAGGSTVGYEVEVTDTRTGAVRRYAKPLHEVPRLVADTGAFACP